MQERWAETKALKEACNSYGPSLTSMKNDENWKSFEEQRARGEVVSEDSLVALFWPFLYFHAESICSFLWQEEEESEDWTWNVGF